MPLSLVPVLRFTSDSTRSPQTPSVQHVVREPGRRDVDRLLEERALERVRLVEDRQDVQRPGVEQPFDGDLGPRLRTVAARLRDAGRPLAARGEDAP